MVQIFAGDSATSGAGAAWESFDFVNSEKYGYLIENSTGEEFEYYTNLYRFDDQNFKLIAAFESIVDEVGDERNITIKLNDEVIYSGSDNPDLWDNVTGWLEHYVYNTDIALRLTAEEIDTSLAEFYKTDTLAWLDNPDAFGALSSLMKEYKSMGQVY